MNVFDLAAKISLDTTAYEQGLASASNTLGKFASGIGKAVTVVGAGAVALGTALVASTGKTAAYGDSIDKMSQKMGLSAKAYQEWDAILQHSGTSIDSMVRGMTTLSKQAESNSDAFQKLGISQEEVASMNQEELFARTIEGLQNMESGTERTVIAQELLGGSAKELGALLNTSAEDTEAMRQAVHDLGGVMSDDAVKAAAAYQDQLQDMQTAFSGLSRNLSSQFMPSVTTVMGGLTKIFSGNAGSGIGQIRQGISSLVKNLATEVPKFLKVGGEIVMAVVTAIIQNLPQVLASGSEIVVNLATGLISMIPDLLNAGIDLLLAIVDGISAALPQLIPVVVQVILTITERLTNPDMLQKLISAAFQILGALASGIVQAIPQLVAKAPQIIGDFLKGLRTLIPQVLAEGKNLLQNFIQGISNALPGVSSKVSEVGSKIKTAFMDFIKRATSWGSDLISNFVSGIRNSIGKVVSAARNVASKVKSILGFSEPEEGPLSNFHTYAPDMMKLFAEGIRKNTHLITDQLEKSFDFGDMLIPTVPTTPITNSAQGAGETFAPTINVYANEGQSAREIAEEVMDIMTAQYDRRKAVYA